MSNKVILAGGSSRGQLLSIDFMLSLAVFVALLLTIITIWSNIDMQVRDVEQRRDMQSITMMVSDMLIRSGGNPEHWENLSDPDEIADVGSIGLARDEHVLDLKKVITFIELDDNVPRYTETKSKMRLANYEAYTNSLDYLGYNVTTGIVRSPIAYFARSDTLSMQILDYLNGSGVVYDFYDGSVGGAFADIDSCDERYYYDMASAGILAPDEVAKMLSFTINNQSQYRTIIIEEPNLPNDIINITGLQEFLNRGGILIVKANSNLAGNNIIDANNFSMHSGQKLLNDPTGNVLNITEPDYIFRLVEKQVPPLQMSTGEQLNVEVHRELGDSDLKIYVADKDDHSKCRMCKWSYGWGTIYYFATVNPAASFTTGGNIGEKFNLVGPRFEFGLYPTVTTEVINVRRMAILEGEDRQIITVNLVVWK